ncbi:MAG: sodium/proline symporter [Candidatus Zixiibacteriota bacterium]|jgi:sodium/proline symporter
MAHGTLVLISFIVYSLFIISVGLYSTRRRKKTVADYVLANRELGPWVSAFSASASAESGWVMLGLVGVAFTDGLAAFWIMPGIAAGYLFNWFVLAERLRKSTADTGAVTLPQFIMHRFGRGSSALRVVSIVIITAAMLGYVAAQMNAAGKAFDAVFELPYWLGVVAGAFIILAYTVTGGFRAVAWTDLIQASFMVVALIGMPILMLADVGGYSTAMYTLAAQNPELLTFSAGNTGWVLLGFVVGFLGIGLGYPGQPHVLARFMAAKDAKTVREGGFIAFGWFFLVYIGAIFFGLFARAYFGNLADPEQALPLATTELLPSIIAGFVIAAIVAAICSTADSQLIVVSSTFSRDVFRRDKGKAENSPAEMRRYQLWDSGTLLVLGLISVFFALTKNRVIFEFVLYAWAVLGACFGPVVILGLLWKRANKAGALAGMITGIVVVLVWRNITVLKSAVYELVPAFILAFLAMVIFSLTTGKPDDANRA